MKKILCLLLLLLTLSTVSFADIAPLPRPSQPGETDKSDTVVMTIRTQRELDKPTLRISKKQLQNLLAEAESAPTSTAPAAGADLPVKAIAIGTFLSLAFVFGGIFMARGSALGKNQKTVALVISAALVGAAASTIYANVAPPYKLGIDETIFSDKIRKSWRGVYDDVRIVVTDTSNTSIYLDIPRVNKTKPSEEE